MLMLISSFNVLLWLQNMSIMESNPSQNDHFDLTFAHDMILFT